MDQLKQNDQKKIRVVISEDHPVVRTQIRRLLDRAGDICIVGEATNGYEAVEMVENLSPDVLLLDVEMPGMNGMLVAKTLSALKSEVRVLVLSGYSDRVFVETMLEHGAMGYLTKDDAGELVVDAIRRVAENEGGWFSKSVQDYAKGGEA